MKISKAIEIATNYSNEFHPCTDFDYAQAIRLLIEAGKYVQEERKRFFHPTLNWLQGETPEIDTKRSLHHTKEILQGTGEHP